MPIKTTKKVTNKKVVKEETKPAVEAKKEEVKTAEVKKATKPAVEIKKEDNEQNNEDQNKNDNNKQNNENDNKKQNNEDDNENKNDNNKNKQIGLNTFLTIIEQRYFDYIDILRSLFKK